MPVDPDSQPRRHFVEMCDASYNAVAVKRSAGYAIELIYEGHNN
jgi:hypothetical protein